MLYQILACIIHGKIQSYKSYKNNKFRISAQEWNEESELPDGSYSLSDKTVNPSIRIYVNKIENRIKFKIQPGYYLQLLPRKTMKLLGSTKSKIKKRKVRKMSLI